MTENIIEFPRHIHPNGTIAVAQNSDIIPFAIKRVFYIYDIPADTSRGGHAHRYGHEIIIATTGSFDVKLIDRNGEKNVTLNRPYKGLHVPPGTWVNLSNFSSGCVCLCLCSNEYDADDYISDFNQFQSLLKND